MMIVPVMLLMMAQAQDMGARIAAAESALEKQDYASAVTQLKALAVERPKYAHVLYDLGFAEERAGDEDGAVTAYSAAITADPEMGESRVALGLLDARNGRMDKARGELGMTAELVKVSPQLRGRALRALAVMNETTDSSLAADELLRAVKLTGETEADVLMSADLASRAGNDADAEAAYRRAAVMDAESVDAIAGLAHSLVRQQKYAEAETALLEAEKTHPDDVRLVSQLAAVYAAENKAALAIPLMEKLRVARPELVTDGSTTRLLAHLYEVNTQNAEAEKLYRSLLARDANDASLLDDFGGVLVKEMKYAEAEVILTKAVSLREGFATPQDWGATEEHLAFAASKNGDPRGSLQALAARATVLPNSPGSLFLEAISHDTLHQFKDAATAYKGFLAIAGGKYPDEEFEARHRLVALEHMK